MHDKHVHVLYIRWRQQDKGTQELKGERVEGGDVTQVAHFFSLLVICLLLRFWVNVLHSKIVSSRSSRPRAGVLFAAPLLGSTPRSGVACLTNPI